MHTLVPYIIYPSPRVKYTRLWLEAPAVGDRGSGERLPPAKKKKKDGAEILAHDWAFPANGHDPAQPIAIVLHGLNGGSAEPLVMDFVAAATERGWTCVVLNARGLGGTELSSAYPFFGARTSDLDALVELVAKAAPGVELIGVGYSMGAIILANYLGVAGNSSGKLSAAVAISGCMDAMANKGRYSSKTLEPFLAYELKVNFCTGPRSVILANAGVDLAAAVGPDVGCIMEFDAATVVPANNFDDVDDYYRHMSLGHLGKERRVTVPLLHVHACDDPIIDCDTFAPYVLRKSLPANLYFLITRNGGHVGWCEGWMPWIGRWSFQNRAVFEFVDAVRTSAPREAREPPSPGTSRRQRALRSPGPRGAVGGRG